MYVTIYTYVYIYINITPPLYSCTPVCIVNTHKEYKYKLAFSGHSPHFYPLKWSLYLINFRLCNLKYNTM